MKEWGKWKVLGCWVGLGVKMEGRGREGGREGGRERANNGVGGRTGSLRGRG